MKIRNMRVTAQVMPRIPYCIGCGRLLAKELAKTIDDLTPMKRQTKPIRQSE